MCPFVAEVNDLSNDCSQTMFSYINLNGGYYPGLFGSICHDGKDGLSCPALPPKSDNYSSNTAHIGRRFSPPLIVFSFSFALGVLCF
ncbi:hypothetical protein QJS10_CPA08g01911 [Acorus calamus]|uniref:GPI-anchored protein LLG1-like domain-containing protein n=1 Tax=Acorus calamus TaxID=4465 RepID=A0AAV9EDN6_ACOCL|nr:hypothetical protein QJS10_CPA08g01911 [Acorus calamus]